MGHRSSSSGSRRSVFRAARSRTLTAFASCFVRKDSAIEMRIKNTFLDFVDSATHEKLSSLRLRRSQSWDQSKSMASTWLVSIPHQEPRTSSEEESEEDHCAKFYHSPETPYSCVHSNSNFAEPFSTMMSARSCIDGHSDFAESFPTMMSARSFVHSHADATEPFPTMMSARSFVHSQAGATEPIAKMLSARSLVDSQADVTEPIAKMASTHNFVDSQSDVAEPFPKMMSARSFVDGQSDATEPAAITTVMIRNFPRRAPQSQLVHLLDHNGFATTYDFVHVPFCVVRKKNLGYAFVNFRSPAVARKLFDQWNMQKVFFAGGNKSLTLSIRVAQIQGREANVEHFMQEGTSAKMANSLLHPIVYGDDGQAIAFSTLLGRKNPGRDRTCRSPPKGAGPR